MISQSHIPYFADVFSIPGFLRDPVLVFGHNDCSFPGAPSFFKELKQKLWVTIDHIRYKLPPKFRVRRQVNIPQRFQHQNLHEILQEFGVRDISTLDLFDPRAQIRHDMNEVIPSDWHERFATIIDIGNLEHVFDTRQCLSNMFAMLQTNGHFFLHTPCSGYFNHGFHTFSPDCLRQAFDLNGLEIIYCAFSTSFGFELEQPSRAVDAICWIVGKKIRPFDKFRFPQQGRWESRYKNVSNSKNY